MNIVLCVWYLVIFNIIFVKVYYLCHEMKWYNRLKDQSEIETLKEVMNELFYSMFIIDVAPYFSLNTVKY